MSKSKRYYWFKLKADYFDDETQIYLEAQENGDSLCLFYLKLCAKAVQFDGRLVRYIGDKMMAYDEAGLARLTRVDEKIVRQALPLLTDIGLVKTLDSGELLLPMLEDMVGSECDSAERVRKLRNKERYNVTEERYNVQNCNTEKEREEETEKETEKEFRVESVEDTAPALKRLNFSFDEKFIEQIERSLKDRDLNIGYLSFVATRLKNKSINHKPYSGMTQSEKQGVFFNAVTKWKNYEEDYRNGETADGRIDNDSEIGEINF